MLRRLARKVLGIERKTLLELKLLYTVNHRVVVPIHCVCPNRHSKISELPQTDELS